jgi:uncharacterized membrane protein YdfJ with MMPL/SSD domain
MFGRPDETRLPVMQRTATERNQMQARNIAASAGRWSAKHRKTAILGWIAFVVIAFMIGGKVGTSTLTNEQNGVGESGKAGKIVADAYPDKVGEMVLVQSTTLQADDPRFRAVVTDVTRRLDRIDGVTNITDPYVKHQDGAAISPKNDAVLVSFEIPGDRRGREGRPEGASRSACRAVRQR